MALVRLDQGSMMAPPVVSENNRMNIFYSLPWEETNETSGACLSRPRRGFVMSARASSAVVPFGRSSSCKKRFEPARFLLIATSSTRIVTSPDPIG
jgi:hypothetical protein